MKTFDPPRFADIFRMLAPPTPTVQVYVITVDGHQMVCIGPVVHGSRTGTYCVQDIEYGEIIPARDAVKLIDGSFTAGQDVQ